MKAAIFHGPRDVQCETVDRPVLEEGEALLRVKACGICGSDLHTYRHGLFPDLGAPTASGRVLGHEFSGEIVETKGDVAFREGDRVVAVSMGANAEFIKVDASEASLTSRFSEEISFEEAATTEPLATSLHAVNLADPQDGETHVIFGAGIIGLGVLQCIKALSSARTITIDISSKRLAMATELGSDVVVNASEVDAVETVLGLTGAKQLNLVETSSGNVDAVYDCAGLGKDYMGTSVLEQGLALANQGGKVVVVAVFERPVEVDVNVVVRKGIRLLGSWAWSREEFDQALDLISSGRIDRKPLVTHRFKLDDARDAYETQLKAEEAVKVMFTP